MKKEEEESGHDETVVPLVVWSVRHTSILHGEMDPLMATYVCMFMHSVATARVACEFQAACDDRRAHLARLIATFQEAMHAHCQSQQEGGMMLLPSDTPIQAFVLPGNDKVGAS